MHPAKKPCGQGQSGGTVVANEMGVEVLNRDAGETL